MDNKKKKIITGGKNDSWTFCWFNLPTQTILSGYNKTKWNSVRTIEIGRLFWFERFGKLVNVGPSIIVSWDPNTILPW